ncbi:glycosyltransferase family 2 protein [Myxacorys almedinensis]|uniref:Glycosyltransferase n=1 Tax=Myxacorys almedinensis A TaxID=2690445 RepID=A0A8J7Z3E6_9CYAN|nr:glycosyltransferase family A protein [Myxacorys almedinensis]NDJ17111.1 glycosyltransferase [Myxacorys almedinensis A]
MNTDQLDFSRPLISVIIPAYNAESFIATTLQSVLTQTYPCLEIIVVDDGSTDRTVEIVQALAKTDPRIILLHQANAGVATARNLAIQASRGEFIAPLDADDIWYPENLEKQLQVMLRSDESVGLVYAWSIYITEDDALTPTCQINCVEGETYIPLLHGNLLGNASSCLIRRSCFERIGGYNAELKEQNAQGCEDWDLYLRIAEQYQFRVVPEILIGYRQVIGSMSFDCEKMMRSCELVLSQIQQQYPEIPTKVFRWTRSNFNWYSALRCEQQGDRSKTIAYLFQAARLDYLPLLRPRFYSMMLSSLLVLLWQHTLAVLGLGDRAQPKSPRSPFRQTQLTLAELNQIQARKHQQFPRKQYGDFLRHRWRSVRQEIGTLSGQQTQVDEVLSMPR